MAAKAPNPQTVIVAVHGVGPASPGDILGVLLSRTNSLASLGHLLVRGVPYPRAQTGGKTLYEVPWADLRPVAAGQLSLVAEVVALLTAMVQAAVELPATRLKLPLARAYKAVLLGAGVWCMWPPIMLLLVQLQHEHGRVRQVLVAAAIVVAVVVLGHWLQRFDGWFRRGSRAWASGMVGLAGWAIAAGAADGAPLVLAARLYAAVQLATLALAAAAMAEGFCRWHQERRQAAKGTPNALQLMTRWAFVYLPFMVASGVGALGWALALQRVPEPAPPGFKSWAETFTCGLPYDLWDAEILFTVGVGSSGAILLAVAAAYCVRSWRRCKRAGIASRDDLAATLFLMPLILAATTALFLADMAWDRLGPWLHRPATGWETVQIYQASALRLVPFLAFLIGPLAVAVKVAGDVVFYLCPKGSPLALREKAKERALRLLKALPRDADVHLVGHSQGSVIALEAAVASDRCMKVHTMGSPIDSLYLRFVGLDLLTNGEELKRVTLTNSYREDDYVGGPVDKRFAKRFAAQNFPVGFGGHTGYWAFLDITSPDPATRFHPPERP